MANTTKQSFLADLQRRYGTFKVLPQSQSLYELHPSRTRLYVRYSKLHKLNQTFYGLREIDLRQLEGHASLICFLWEGQSEPLFLPFEAYEQVFLTTPPAKDGQYKAQIFLQQSGIDLYFPKAGRFNVEGNVGWSQLDSYTQGVRSDVPHLSHGQVQTLLGAIGAAKGHDIWLPNYDRAKLDWSIAKKFVCRDVAPLGFYSVAHILREVDVIWLQKGSSEPKALFEVEHSTSIYSGLLRFNDFHLVAPELRPRFSIVADDLRRDVFAKHLNRPTFRVNGLNENCSFLDYVNVYEWHRRINSNANFDLREKLDE